MRDRALERLTPPWLDVRVKGGAGRLKLGLDIDLTVRKFGVCFKCSFTVTEFQSDKKFVDQQVRGPFAKWRHEHLFEEAGLASLMADDISFSLPLALVSEPLFGNFIEEDLKRVFRYRHEVLKWDLAGFMRNSDRPRQKVLIFDSHNQLSEPLLNFLSTQGHAVETYPHGRIIKDQLKTEKELAAKFLHGEFNAFVSLSPFCSSSQWEIDTRRTFLHALAESKEDSVFVDVHVPHPGQCYLETWQQYCLFNTPVTRCVFAEAGDILSPAFGVLKEQPDWKHSALENESAGRPLSAWIAVDDAVAAIEHCLFRPDIAGLVDLSAPGSVVKETPAQSVTDFAYAFRYERLQAALNHVLGV